MLKEVRRIAQECRLTRFGWRLCRRCRAGGFYARCGYTDRGRAILSRYALGLLRTAARVCGGSARQVRSVVHTSIVQRIAAPIRFNSRRECVQQVQAAEIVARKLPYFPVFFTAFYPHGCAFEPRSPALALVERGLSRELKRLRRAIVVRWKCGPRFLLVAHSHRRRRAQFVIDQGRISINRAPPVGVTTTCVETASPGIGGIGVQRIASAGHSCAIRRTSFRHSPAKP